MRDLEVCFLPIRRRSRQSNNFPTWRRNNNLPGLVTRFTLGPEPVEKSMCKTWTAALHYSMRHEISTTWNHSVRYMVLIKLLYPLKMAKLMSCWRRCVGNRLLGAKLLHLGNRRAEQRSVESCKSWITRSLSVPCSMEEWYIVIQKFETPAFLKDPN